ncbi:hypothetical protein SAMN05444157_1542 [Frankineae bacterium MT45]|nr:hypothetical protein SAMN05444157_1542 [Frankineae bacterium MT45]
MTSENPYAGQGAVMLDIGGEIGALVISMPAELEGVEIEIRPAAGSTLHWHHLPHVAVVLRPTPRGPRPSAVFPELPSGEYEAYERGQAGRGLLPVTVVGAEVTYRQWAVPDEQAGPSGGSSGEAGSPGHPEGSSSGAALALLSGCREPR